MTVVLVVGAIAVVGAVVVGATWRRSADERQSVRDYHQTLETLRHLSNRNAGEALRQTPGQAPRGPRRQPDPSRRDRESTGGGSPTTGGPAPAGDPRTPADTALDGGAGAPAISRSGTLVGRSGSPRNGSAADVVASARDGGGRKTMAFGDDAAGSSPIAASATVSELASGRALYRQRRPAHSGSPLQPRRRSLLTATTVVVLAAVVAVAIALAPSRSSHRPAASSSRTTSAHSSGPSTKSGSSSHARKTPTPAPQTLQPVTSSADAAAYTAPAGAYSVELAASGPCWILATEITTGKVLWTGTLGAGDIRQIPATGGLSVRIGADNVTVALNGKPVTLPAGHQSPFNLTFQSA